MKDYRLAAPLHIALIMLILQSAAFAQAVTDPNLKLQTWVSGLDQPTGAAFVDNGNTTLVLEKSTGRVKIVQNRRVTGTALDLPVASDSERGLLGIALPPDFAATKSVYLYYTHAAADGGDATDNRVERFTWTGSRLVFDRRVLTLPAQPGPNHNGGKIAFGPDGKLYAVIGDLNLNGQTQNFQKSPELTASGAILRVNPSGSIPTNNPFSNPRSRNSPLNRIFAYGVRNSFGLAFDPVNGALWDTENGPDRMDEINRISAGFNSGWQDVMGPVSRGGSIDGLTILGPAAHYDDPQLSWATPIAPTDAFFMDTARIGRAYKSDLFVGTLHGGAILDFDLTHTRNHLRVAGALADGVADNTADNLFAEESDHIFAQGFGTVSDLLSGPGGMYVLSLTNGAMYRITTSIPISPAALPTNTVAVPEPGAASLVVLASAFFFRRQGRRSVRHANTCFRDARPCLR